MLPIAARRVALLGGARASAPLLNGLVSYWSLEEASGTRADSHGTNHLTDNNTVTQAAGKVGQAAQFTAANLEYLSIADNPSLRMGNSDFTFACWCKADTIASFNTLLAKWPDYWLYTTNNAGSGARFRINGGTEVTSVITLSTGAWYFIIAGRDALNQTIFIQVNNAVVATAAAVASVTDSAATFRVGARVPDMYFDGAQDEIMLWKRLLTTTEKTWLWNGGAGRSYADLRSYHG